MIYPMRMYGYTVTERFLSSMANILGLLLIAGSLVLTGTASRLLLDTMWGGMLTLAVFITGVILSLGSGGIRQNRAAFNYGLRMTLATGTAWGIYALSSPAGVVVAAIVCGVHIAMYTLCHVARREIIRSRFKPRFFSLREFETMISIADALFDGKRDELHPIERVARTDRLLAQRRGEWRKGMQGLLLYIEWVLPLRMLRPVPFSELGTHARRRLVRRVATSKGRMRDLFEDIKLLMTVTEQINH